MPASPQGSDDLDRQPDDPPGPPFVDLDWTTYEHLEERHDVQALLALGEIQVLTELYAHASEITLSVEFICQVHNTLFESVWPDYAGCLRGYGTQQWPYSADIGGIGYGSPPERVTVDLQQVVDEAHAYLDSLDAAQDSIPREELRSSALQVGGWLHCVVDRIHPFVNGNGRTSRALMHYVLARYGFPPLDWDRGRRSDYYAMFRLFYRESILEGFTWFVNRVQFLQDTQQVQLLGDEEIVHESDCSPAEAREHERIQRKRRRSLS